MGRKKKLSRKPNPSAQRSIEFYNLAREAASGEQFEQAMELYRKALAVEPGLTAANVGLGYVLYLQKEFKEAEGVLRKAVALAPNMPEALNLLGAVLREVGQLDEALVCFQRVLELQPSADAHKNLGRVYGQLDRREEAIAAFQRALSMDPRCASTLSDLGTLYQRNFEYEKARHCFEASLRIDPAKHLALNNQAFLNLTLGFVEVAVEGFRKAMKACPSYLGAQDNLLLAYHYLPDARPDDLFREHKAWGEKCAVTVLPSAFQVTHRDPEKPLRVGFLSPDIRAHSVAYFLESILDSCDHRRIHPYGYAEVARPDTTTERLRTKFSAYRSTVGLSDEDVARMIAHDGIDILVDLAGHTANNRLMAMPRRPAPIQMTYLGYPDTTGIPAVDFRLTDALADPPGQERYYTEKLVRLPDCFLCYRPPDDAPPPSPPPFQARSHVTFGSFNSASKLNADLIRVWSELLKQVKNSRLILKNAAFRDPETQERYYGLFRDQGIDRERLQLMGWETVRAHHLSLYNEIDVCLDTFPYHGTTTTCEALWMGVPVVTRRGLIHASRVGCSLLHQVKLDDLVTDDEGSYVATAVRLAGDTERLVDLRCSLREAMKRSPLCDAPSFNRKLERVFREIWQAWCHERAPQMARDSIEPAAAARSGPAMDNGPALVGDRTLALRRRAQQAAQDGRVEEAIEAYREALACGSDCVQTNQELGLLLKQIGRLDEAQTCFERVVERQPDQAEAFRNLGYVLTRQNRIAKAVAAFKRALVLEPNSAETWSDLGVVYERSQRYDEARTCFEQSLRLKPGHPPALNNLAKTAKDQGRIDEAIGWYRKALDSEPDYAVAHSNLLVALHYREDLQPEELLREHRKWGERHAPSTLAARTHANPVDEQRPLRIAYLTPDLRTHSVSFFLEAILDAHDRSLYEPWVYAEVRHPDSTTERLKPKFAAYRSTVGLSDGDVAEMIRRDGIDLLIDLAGHFADNRLPVLARKPAPVQVTYLGYPDTTGIGAVDYRLTDSLADPEGADEYYTERLIRLPHCFLCYRPPIDTPTVCACPSERGAPITFGCFNALPKVNGKLVCSWARLLGRVPGARLLMKAVAFQSAEMRENYCRAFRDQGVESDRLLLVSWEPELASHLNLYDEVDIALDTFPYHGTTTTCEALWMGVPVVTRKGAVHASRVGCSLLHQVGLDDLVASDEEDYIKKAAQLAADQTRRSALRATLRERMARSPLCDARTFTHHLEQAFRFMWQTWCRKAAGRQGASTRDETSTCEETLNGPVYSASCSPVGDSIPVNSTPPAAGAPPMAKPCRTVESAIQADALNRMGQRSKALVCALEGWTNIKVGRFHREAPASLLQTWQSPTLEGVLLRQCLALSSHSSYYDRVHAKEWLLAWSKLEPSHPEPFLRLGLVLALESALAAASAPTVVVDSLTHAARLMQDERSAKALALCSGPLSELSLPYDGGHISVRPDIRDLTTYVLLEQGDWFDEDLDLFRALAKPGMSMLDLGANVGVYSFSAAQRMGPQGRVASVESEPSACELMARTADPFPQWAVCGGEQCHRVSVDTIVKQLGGEAFDLIRIDTERYPVDNLDGARELLGAHSPVVFYSVRKGSEVNTPLIQAFRNVGYESQLYLSATKTLVPLDPETPADTLVLNAIAARPGRIEEFMNRH